MQDEIVFVDEAWRRFAEANDGGDLGGAQVLGRPLWDFVADGATRQLYQQIVARVRQGGPARFTLRCDGPSCRRLMEMTISAGEEGTVEFETRALRVEPREPPRLLAIDTRRSGELLRCCAWCNRIDVGLGAWEEVEEATERLRLFELDRMPQLTHGACDACLASMTSALAEVDAPGLAPLGGAGPVA